MKIHEELTGSPNKECCVWCVYPASPASSESCRAMVRSSSSREVVVLEVEVVEPKYPRRDHTPPKRTKEIRLSIYLTQIPTFFRPIMSNKIWQKTSPRKNGSEITIATQNNQKELHSVEEKRQWPLSRDDT